MITFKNTLIYLDIAVISNNGNFVPGLTVTYKIYKSSDNSVIASGTMVEVGATGTYQTSYTFSENGQYRAEYTSPTPYENAIETIFVNEIDKQIERILGLSQENYRIFNPQYDRYTNLIQGTIKIYPTATDCDDDTNPTAVYEITAQYNKSAMTGYKVKKIS